MEPQHVPAQYFLAETFHSEQGQLLWFQQRNDRGRSPVANRLAQGLYQGLVILLLVGGLAGLYASGTGRIASLGTVVLILVRDVPLRYGDSAEDQVGSSVRERIRLG